MKSIIKKLLLIIIAFTILPVNAAKLSAKTSELQQLKQIIKQLESSLTTAHHRQTTLQQQLKINETATGNLAIKSKRTEHKLTKQQKILQQLQRDKIAYQKQLVTQQKKLVEQIRTTYMLGKHTYLRMLLNHQDPNQLSRTFVYYGYLQKTRAKTIEALRYTLKQLQKNKRAKQQQTQKLLVLKKEQHREYTKLNTIKQSREHLLTAISKDINTKQQKLTKLVANQKALEKVIAKLKVKETSLAFATPLGKLHQKLHWPTKGKVNYLYGQKIGQSQLKWNGDIIYAPEGQNVHAISNGKVVFSQWLQGYGLLLIIDHGHGYMSLYGRNNSLYKKVGDMVHTGDLIATVGNSGGYNKPSLYFAIRHNGEAVNPKSWCHG